jgi:hypothetical protein
MSKKIILTETQERELIKHILKEEKRYPVNLDLVLRVKEYLDKNFQRGNLGEFKSDKPVNTPIVGMLLNNKVVKNLSDQQLLDILMDKFKVMYDNEEQLKWFLTKVMIHWYYKKISKEGVLIGN